MATDYTDTTAVQARFPHLTFTATSEPNLTQIGLFIADASAEIDAILLPAYDLPIEGDEQLAFLKQGASAGAAALVDRAIADAQDDDAVQSQWTAPWKEFKEQLRKRGLPGAIRRGVTVPGFLYSGVS